MTVHVKMHVTVHVTVHAKRENDVVEQENESMRDGKGKNKKKKWIKRRHAVIMNLARPFFNAFLRVKCGVKVHKFREENNRQYLIVMNHQTVFDQFFVGIAFKKPVYYIATEDIFSNGFISKLLTWAVNPIPIKKQTLDMRAIMNCIQVAKEGGTIALAPEGNRTYSGKTAYIKPSIAKLVRKLGLPLAIFRIEDGYGVQPRWCDQVRKGKMSAKVTRVVEPEEIKTLSDDELYEIIRSELDVNEACAGGPFKGKHLAEYLERAIYVCPVCGLAAHESHGNFIECTKCHNKVQYLPSRELQGVKGEFPFRFVADWYEYQYSVVNQLDPAQHREEPLFRDRAGLSEVILYKKKQPIHDEIGVALYGDRIVIGEGTGDELMMPFDEVSSVAVLGRNKLNIYFGDKVYQVKGDKRFNALKYVNLYHRYMNVKEGNPDGEFLGL